MDERQYWLVKTEPDVYSIDNLRADGTSPWEGVRNHQAKNFIKAMKVDDLLLFYHSNAKPPGVVGLARVVAAAYPDPTSWDKRSKYFDPKSTTETPRWWRVDVGFVEKWERMVSLDELKGDTALDGMLVRKKGQRLSVQPVTLEHFDRVISLGRRTGRAR